MIKDKRFYPAFWTQFFGAFNDNVFKNALIILITYKAYSIGTISPEQMVALCSAIFILPFFLFSSIAGQICDKYAKDKLIVKIKLAEIVIMIFAAIGFFTSNIMILVSALFFMGTQSSIFGPIKYSILPEIVKESELTHANALFSMGTFLSILLGTILGGTLIAVDSLGSSITAIVVILLAIIGYLFSLKIVTPKKDTSHIKIDLNPVNTTLDILRITKENNDVYHAVLGISWFWLIGAVLLSLFPVYAKNIVTADEGVTTFFLALFSVGVAFGSLLCNRISKSHIDYGLISFGSLGLSLFSILIYFIPTVQSDKLLSLGEFLTYPSSYFISLTLLMISVFAGLFIVPLITLIQRDSAPDKRSRVIAGNNILNAIFMVVGSIGLALLYSFDLNAKDMYLVIGILNLAAFYFFYKKYSEYFWRLACELFTKMFYKFSFEGEENIPSDGPVILIANHVSYIDWLFMTAVTKRTPKFVMWYVFFKMPIINIFFKGAKAIPIAGIKEDQSVMHKAFKDIDLALKNQHSVAYFPEGFITGDGEMLFFRPGLDRITACNDVKIVPMYIDGMWGSFFSRKNGKACTSLKALLREFKRKVDVQVGEPFYFIDSEDAKSKVQSLIKK